MRAVSAAEKQCPSQHVFIRLMQNYIRARQFVSGTVAVRLEQDCGPFVDDGIPKLRAMAAFLLAPTLLA
jgi:hypothetical protein